MHTFTERFFKEPAQHCTCDQWVVGTMPGSCRLFLQLPAHTEDTGAGGNVFGLQMQGD